MLYLIIILSFVFPLFFLPIISDPILGAKAFFLAVWTLLILVVAGLKLIRSKKLAYSIKPLDILVLLFALINWVSWYFLPSGAKVRSLIQPLGVGSVTALTLFYYSLVQLNAKNKKEKVANTLALSAAIVSLVSIVSFVLGGIGPQIIRNVLTWISFGSPFLVLEFLIPLSVFVVAGIVKGKKEKSKGSLKLVVLGVVLLVGVGVCAYQSIKARPVFLDWFSSWAISAESFKRKTFLGVGPSNFTSAFTLYRPAEFNQTDNWALRFSASRSWFLQVWTEVGLVGFGLLVLMLLRSLPLIRKSRFGLFLAAAWLILIVFPGNIVNVFVLFLALALTRGKAEERSFALTVGDRGKNGAPPIAGALMVITALLSGYFVIRGFWAENLFYRSLQAAAQNKGGDTYNLQLDAINENRFSSQFRTTFAQTNLALAISLASKGEELTDQDRTQITQLMGQAVSEGKAAVALDPTNAVAWENLAQIYRQLVGVAEGADQWVVATYQQTISMDGLNPRLRVDYAGLLYAMGAYADAARQLEVAVNLRSNYANAWYNWAWSLKQLNLLEDAVIKMQQTVNLVDPSSADYEKAKGELDQWQEELGKAVAEQKKKQELTELTQPEPLPSPKLEEPIRLPEEAAPPLEKETAKEETVEEISPTVTPEPTPEAE